MTEPYYEGDGVTLYHGDALAVLRDLPSGSVDAVITDPPYSSGGAMRSDRAHGTTLSKYVNSDSGSQDTLLDFSGDNRDQRGYEYWCALWLSASLRATRAGGVALLFTDWRQLPVTSDALQAGGFVWRGLVPWVKTSARPTAGRFTNQAEYVVWGSAGSMGMDYDAACLPGFYQANAPRDREHITQKPLDVMRQLVRIVPEGGTILDPFMGSGTTGVAAVMEGRKFIGVEMNDHYIEVARRRIVDGYAADPNPEQEALL